MLILIFKLILRCGSHIPSSSLLILGGVNWMHAAYQPHHSSHLYMKIFAADAMLTREKKEMA